ELVELERSSQESYVEQIPYPEPHVIDIDELQGAGERRDLIGGPNLGSHDSIEEFALVACLVVHDFVEVAVFDTVSLVDDPTGRAGERIFRGSHGTSVASSVPRLSSSTRRRHHDAAGSVRILTHWTWRSRGGSCRIGPR